MKYNNRYELANGYTLRLFAKNYNEYSAFVIKNNVLEKIFNFKSLLKAKRLAIEYIKQQKAGD